MAGLNWIDKAGIGGIGAGTGGVEEVFSGGGVFFRRGAGEIAMTFSSWEDPSCFGAGEFILLCRDRNTCGPCSML